MYEHMTFESILERMLGCVPTTMDKREGSIIYDAVAPCAVELQLMYIELDNIIKESFGDTATRPFLVKRAAERGLYPYPASHAILRGLFVPPDIQVPTGARFNCHEYNYVVVKHIEGGEYQLECETIGREGNAVLGELTPIEYLRGLESAELVEVLIPGEADEDTELFRTRYLNSFNPQAYGGNIADYKEKVSAIGGVGAVKVTPVWDGGGTVKLTIIDSEYNAPTAELINAVQTAVDPEQNRGEGLGLAPIGHTVTVVGADEISINIDTEIVFKDDYNLDVAVVELQAIVDSYLLDLRKKWDNGSNLVVRISQIEYGILGCEMVLDVANTKVNGVAANLIMGSFQVPKRGTINER